MDVILYSKIQKVDSFVGDVNSDIGTHTEIKENDLTNISTASSVVDAGVTFDQTATTIKAVGTTSSLLLRTIQDNIPYKANTLYKITMTEAIQSEGFQIQLFDITGDTVAEVFNYSGGNTEIEHTFEANGYMKLRVYAANNTAINDEHTISIIEYNQVDEKNTVADAISQQMQNMDNILFSAKIHNVYEQETADDVMDNYILQNGVPISASWSAYYYVSDYIPVAGGKTIKFSFAPWYDADANFRAAEYDSNKTYIKNITSTEHDLSANAKYIRFNVKKSQFGGTLTNALKYVNENLLLTDEPIIDESGLDKEKNTFLSASATREADTFYVDASGSEMLVLWKMPGADDKDVGVKFKTFTNNSAYQFCSVGTVQNPSPFVGNKPENYVEYMATAEDWFSPMKVNAVNNIDGDTPDTLKWSGGFHQNNGVNTSRRVSLDIYFDGRKKEKFVGYCNTIDIYIVHQLVASNTFKSDGTGREVIKETIHVQFANGKINVETTCKALEPVTVYVWYFLQSHHKTTGLGSSGIRYIGSEANRGINSMDEASDAGDLYARTMRLLSNTLQMDMSVEDYDIGRFAHAVGKTSFVRFYTTYSKPYFNMIDDSGSPMTLDTGESFMAKGSYKFGIFE